LLISAAKQSGVKYDAARLRWAMMSSARFLSGYGAEAQGAGLLQVDAAWEALKTAPNPIQIMSRAPVKAVLSEYLHEPNQGIGIYEREGWTAGQLGQRMITFTRTSGDSKPITYSLRWTGNDGTYLTAQEITLPLRVPVELPVRINPKTMGVHSAILNLDSLTAPAIYQVLTTVVAAEQFTAANRFSFSRPGEVNWLDSQSYFIRVPPGVAALRVDIKITQGNVMPSLTRPNGRFYYSLAFDPRPVKFTAYQTAGSWSRVIARPDPGVWQMTVDNCDIYEPVPDRKHDNALFAITATLMGVEIHPSELMVNLALNGSRYSKTISFQNKLGSFTGGLAGGPLSSVFSALLTSNWRDGTVQYQIAIPPGSTKLGALVSAGLSADIDLYLFDCTGKECVLKDFSNGAGSNERVEVAAPAAGSWKVLIDSFSHPRNEISFNYRDYFMHPAFGNITAKENSGRHDNGITVMQDVILQVDALPVGTRYVAGTVDVLGLASSNTDSQLKNSESSQPAYPKQAVLGSADVDIKNQGRVSTKLQ
ncbi:MAG: PPC domain-containing protein, partial [Pyrinomonadaceae bacterium]